MARRVAPLLAAAVVLLAAVACGYAAWRADRILVPWEGPAEGRLPDAAAGEVRLALGLLAGLFALHAAATAALGWRRKPGSRDTLLAAIQMPLVPLLGVAVQPGWAWLAAPALAALLVLAACAMAGRVRVHDATATPTAAHPQAADPGKRGAWTCRTCTRRYPVHIAMGRTPRCPQCA